MNMVVNKKCIWLILSAILLPNLCYADQRLYSINLFTHQELIYIETLLLAFTLGCLCGGSHSIGKKASVTVGFKTYGAISLGAALFSCSILHTSSSTHLSGFNSLAGIVTGVGFLCAAVIFKEGLTVRGLTTAATLWTTAIIGLATGLGLWGLSITSTIIVFIFHLLPTQITALHIENPNHDQK